MNRSIKFHNFAVTLLMLAVSALSVAGQADKTDPANDFYRLTDAAPRAFNAGQYEEAEALSNKLLVASESWKTNWNYGNAIHVANLVLGRAALRRDETEAARKFLARAGKTPGSPQLNTFGPDMLFAKEMLEAGETKAVLDYFDLCAKFWNEKHASTLEEWRAAIAKNETPDFGPNLRYFF